MHRVLVLIQVGHEVLDAALVLELGAVPLAALVGYRDLQATREEGGLAQTLLERVEIEVQRLEDVGVGEERHRSAGGRVLGELRSALQLALRRAARVLLRPLIVIAANLHAQQF